MYCEMLIDCGIRGTDVKFMLDFVREYSRTAKS